ncbi:MAG: polymerase sigma-70 factor [Planctomycetaceae bacterium]|nr:polymerase sigma-70 factor [Planctomycetaceae bacterium]
MSTKGYHRDLAKTGPLTAAPSAEFVQLFTRSQRPVFLYILSLLPRPTEAEEILQETNLVIWTKASQFQPGTNFRAWACQIAYFEVMKYRSRKHRDKLHFNPELLELVAAESLQQSELLDRRRQALAECLAKLREQDRALIQTRYSPGNDEAEEGLVDETPGDDHRAKEHDVKDYRAKDQPGIAEKLGRPINSIYQSLSRIRKSLLECINRRLAAEARG